MTEETNTILSVSVEFAAEDIMNRKLSDIERAELLAIVSEWFSLDSVFRDLQSYIRETYPRFWRG